MNSISDLRRGVARAWDSVTEGWHELTQRAGDALTRFNPVAGAGELETRDEQRLAAGTRWSVLAAELALHDDSVEVTLEVPGMEAGDFEISVVDDLLIVRGDKRVERSRQHGQYHVMERAYGRFERAIGLPVAVDEHSAKADYRRGVLRITLPRAASSKIRRIPVQSA